MPDAALCLRVVGVAWVYGASWGACHGLVFFWMFRGGTFDFTALWAPFVERTGSQATSAV